MSADPHEVLGVAKDASVEDIRKADRALAKKLHPDRTWNRGRRRSSRRSSAAYDLVGDPEMRARTTRATSMPPRRAAAARLLPRSRRGARDRDASADGFADMAGADDIRRRFSPWRPAATAHARAGCPLSAGARLLDAVNGAKRRRPCPTVGADVTIPAGTRDGQTLRRRGKGLPGLNGGPSGDALVRSPCARTARSRARTTISISSCRSRCASRARRQGRRADPGGSVTMTAPRWSNTGSVLRLKGKGAAAPRRQPRRPIRHVK